MFPRIRSGKADIARRLSTSRVIMSASYDLEGRASPRLIFSELSGNGEICMRVGPEAISHRLDW